MPSANPGPDFLCIGLPKAATSWLFHQLRDHPDFWMPPAKELHYLDRKAPKMGDAIRMYERQGDKIVKDARDTDFFAEAKAASGQPRDLDRYASLFRFKGDLLSGDISPGYCRLDEAMIGDVARKFPWLKIVLLLRDPVSRAWSRICMSHRGGDFDESILGDRKRFRQYLRQTGKIAERSFATDIAARWKASAPELPFQYFFFDDIVSKPEVVRREVLTFLGADCCKGGVELSPDFNKKSGTRKLTLTKPIEKVLIGFFQDEIRQCAEIFGGPAVNWVTKYGL